MIRARHGLAALLLLSGMAQAHFEPTIVGNASHPQCRQAHAMAIRTFRSTSPSLLWPITAPSGSRITLAPNVEDLSGGDYGLTADAAIFRRIESPRDGYHFVTYWQREPRFGRRIALIDREQSWRGDWYTVHLLGPSVAPDRLSKAMDRVSSGGAEWKPFEPVLGDNRWLPPIFFRDAASGIDWFVDRGNSWEVEADWAVHTIERKGLRSPCRLRFASPKGLVRLPSAVRRLAAELDEALGPEDEEGTLHVVAGMRIDIERSWANAATRPWALTDQPYNSRPQIDAGLAAWARQTPSQGRLHAAILRDYSAAERALAQILCRPFRHRP